MYVFTINRGRFVNNTQPHFPSINRTLLYLIFPSKEFDIVVSQKLVKQKSFFLWIRHRKVFQQTNDSDQQIALFIVDWTFQTIIRTCFNIFGILRHDQSYNWQTSELTRLANQTETFKVKFDTHIHSSSKVVLLYRFACIIRNATSLLYKMFNLNLKFL